MAWHRQLLQGQDKQLAILRPQLDTSQHLQAMDLQAGWRDQLEHLATGLVLDLVHRLRHTQPTVEEHPTASRPVAAPQAIQLAVQVEAQPTDLLQRAGLQPMRQATLPTAQLSPIMALPTRIQPVEPQDKAAPKETLPPPQTTAERKLTAETPLRRQPLESRT